MAEHFLTPLSLKETESTSMQYGVEMHKPALNKIAARSSSPAF